MPDIDIHRGDLAFDAAVPTFLWVGGQEDTLARAGEDRETVTVQRHERIDRLEDCVVPCQGTKCVGHIQCGRLYEGDLVGYAHVLETVAVEPFMRLYVVGEFEPVSYKEEMSSA